MLRATTACTFSKLDISASKSGPRMVCFVHFDFEMCFAPQRRALFRNSTLKLPKVVREVLRATTACTFSTSQPPKVVRTWCVLYILTWKCASRHNGVHFFDISTSKSGPTMVCFVHFDLEMCFAPQRRALFRHLNFQKWSDHGVFCTFWLGNVLRATTACTFSTSQLPKVVRTWCVLYILTSKCASRHNGVQFFISHLASWLRTRRFSEPTFRPSGATNHWKNTVNRDFPTFSRIYIFFLLTLLTSAFQLSILSEVSLLNFLRLFPFFPIMKEHEGQAKFTGWLQVVSCGPISTLYAMMNERAANCWSCASVSKPLEEPVLPEMPFAPPEGDYGDDSETTEHLEQFRHEQGRDTLVSASGSNGSSYQAGQMFMGTWRPKGGIRCTILIYTTWFVGKC